MELIKRMFEPLKLTFYRRIKSCLLQRRRGTAAAVDEEITSPLISVIKPTVFHKVIIHVF